MASMRRTRTSCTVSRHHRVLRALVLGATALSFVAASEASAQFTYGSMGAYRGPIDDDDMAPMPPRAVVYRLQDRGFSEIARPRFDGRAYVVDATNPAGYRVRLYVDAGSGSIVGRQRLDAPPARVARAAPGYGWTDDEPAARRGRRDPEALLPPGDIPLPRPSLQTEVERPPRLASRPGLADPSTFGVNPDARLGARPEPRKTDKPTQRKTAKLTPPVKPAAPRVSPEAPVPQAAPAEPSAPVNAATPESAKAPEIAKSPDATAAAVEPPKAQTVPVLPATNLPLGEGHATEEPSARASAEKPTEAPATSQATAKPEVPTEPRASEKAAEAPAPTQQATERPGEAAAAPQIADKPPEQASGETKQTSAAPIATDTPKPAAKAETKEAANQQWQDPPSGEAKRKVRIIGGATIVPRDSGAASGDTAPPAAN